MAERLIKRWKFLVWELIKQYIRTKAKNRCMRCKKLKAKGLLHTHHLIPRAKGNYAMYELDNIVCLCHYCHKRWWHGSSTWDEQRDLIAEWIGLERYYEIKKQSYQKKSMKWYDYEEMIKELEVKIEEL